MQLRLHKKAFRELTLDELYELLRVRSEVFVVEQDCVYQDMDGDDQASEGRAYIGTDMTTPSPRGRLGEGSYLTQKRVSWRRYRKNVMNKAASLLNPLMPILSAVY